MGPAPGTTIRPARGPSYLTSQPSYYAPDDIWSLEFGEKAKLDDRRFTVNADVFYVKWHNIQQLIVLSCGYPYNTNVGDAKSYGPELEMAAKITDELTVDLSGAYTQALHQRAESHPRADCRGTPGVPVYSGQRITNIPKYTGDLAVSYESMLPPRLRIHVPRSRVLRGPDRRIRPITARPWDPTACSTSGWGWARTPGRHPCSAPI